MGFDRELTLEHIEVYPIRASGGTSPTMALGAMPARPALLLRVCDNQNCFGWGEVWTNFPPRANLHKAHLIQDVVAAPLHRFSFTDPLEVDAFLREKLSTYFLHIGQLQVFEHILAGLDIALWDLALRSAGKSFAEHMDLPDPCAASYASSINPNDLDRLLPQHAEYGQQHFKLKIGRDTQQDYEFVKKASALRPVESRIIVDSNQSWNCEQAESMLRLLDDFDLLFAEEPIPANAGYHEWEQLAKSTDVPLAGGENLYGVDEFLRMSDSGLQYLQPDVAKWGGLTGSLALAKAMPAGAKLWPHFMGTAVGQVAALSVTAAVDTESVCEMDVNSNVLRTELCGNILNIRDGSLALPDMPGLVFPPLEQYVSEYLEPL